MACAPSWLRYGWNEAQSRYERACVFAYRIGRIPPLTLGNVSRFIFIPLALEPAWQSLIAAAVTGFLSYEGFHFARKVPPKG